MPGFFLVLFLALPSLAIAGWMIHDLGRRLRQAEAAAARAQNQSEGRGRCLGLLAQDLQGPGLALLGHAATLPGPEAAAIDAEARRVLRYADDVAEYLAAETGPRQLDPAPLPLGPLLAEAVATVAAQLGPGRRAWRVAPAFADLTLTADRRALQGALLQVMGRAARMTREGDQIDLRPVLAEDSVAIVVEDDGAGLPAADLSIGAPDGTRGLGHGLAVARALLEAHGGALRLEALPGVGARAWLTLPRKLLVTAEPPQADAGALQAV
jgi:signal transduction histidine kinase